MHASSCRVLAVLLAALTSLAQAQVFTDPELFAAAAGPLAQESFECFPAGSVSSAAPIETPAFVMTIAPALGSTLAPMNVQAAPNPNGPHATHGTRFVQLGATPSTNGQFDLTITFVAPIEEIGFTVTDFGEYADHPGSLTVTVLGTTYTVASNPPVQADGGERFWGIRSPTPFQTLVVRKSTTGDGIGLDELVHSDLGLADHCASIWTSLGGGVPGPNGLPVLTGVGCLEAGETTEIVLVDGPPSGKSWLVLGGSEVGAPFKGGTLWPHPDVILPGLPLDASGSLTIAFTWPAGLPPGVTLTWQHWMPPAPGLPTWAGSNGLRATTP